MRGTWLLCSALLATLCGAGCLQDYSLRSSSPELTGAAFLVAAALGQSGTVASGLTVTEGGSGATYTLRLESEPSASVFVELSTANGQVTLNGQNPPVTLEFTPENYAVPQTISVDAIDDNIAEPPSQSETINHTVVAGDADFLQNPNLGTTDITVIDNDVANVLASQTSFTINENGAAQNYTLTLATEPTGTVQVDVSFDGTQVTVDSQTTTQSYTFNSGNWNTGYTIAVQPVDDNYAEASTHSANLTQTINGGGTSDSNYSGLGSSVVSVNINDNETANVLISKTSTAVTEGGATDSYTVSLTDRPYSNVTVTVTPDSETTVNSSTSPIALTFTPSSWSAQTVTVGARDDSIIESSEAGTITHSVSGNPIYAAITPSNVNVTITDNDLATVGGTISGLSGGENITLRNTYTSGTENLVVSSNGSFQFSNGVGGGGSYTITINAQSVAVPGLACGLANASGTIAGANVSNIEVDCHHPRLWLRADSGVTESGGNVTQWNDLSGNAHHVFQSPAGCGSCACTSPTLVTSVINGQPVLRFSTNTNCLAIAAASEPAFDIATPSVFAVAARTAGSYSCTGSAAIFAKDFGSGQFSNDWRKLELNSGGFFRSGRDSDSFRWESCSGNMTWSGFRIISASSFSNNSHDYGSNGVAGTSGSTLQHTSYNDALLTIGRVKPDSFTGEAFSGDIAEILIYPTGLSRNARQRVDCYLNGRYSIGLAHSCPP